MRPSAVWQSRFNADPSAIGRTIDLDREPWTIVGIGPREFRGLSGQADVFLPVTTEPAPLLGPETYLFSLIARRAPGVTALRAADEMSTLGARTANEFPNPIGKLEWQVRASALDAMRLDPLVKRSLLVLFGAAWLVLGIACVNVANLLLGRASARRREIAVRIAIALDWHALAFTLCTSLVVGLVFGLAPALGATRASLSDALESDRMAAGAGVGRRTLVVTEIALALVLLVASGLMVRSLAKLLSVDVGFDMSNVLTFRFEVPPGSVAVDSMPGFYSRILDRVRAVPGVADAALDSCVPLTRTCRLTPLWRADVPVPDNVYMKMTGVDVVTPNWFALMRVPLVRGRPFSTTDRPDGPKVVLLNGSAAKTFFGAADPIGKQISVGMAVKNAELIGIVGDVRQMPDSAPGPTTYVPSTQLPQEHMIVFVRTLRDAAMLGGALRRAVHVLSFAVTAARSRAHACCARTCSI